MNLFFKYFQKSVLFLVDIMYFVKKKTFHIILDKKNLNQKGRLRGKLRIILPIKYSSNRGYAETKFIRGKVIIQNILGVYF